MQVSWQCKGFSLNPLLLSWKNVVLQLQNHPWLLEEMIQVEVSGGGFFVLNTLLKLLLLASCGLLLISSLKYSLYFPHKLSV